MGNAGGYPSRETQPGVRHHLVRIEGAGAANPDKEVGAGVTVTWVSTGRYRITWTENPGGGTGGGFMGHTFGFQATTPADVDGWTCVVGAFDTTNKRIDVYVYSDTPALADLAANQWLFLDLRFFETSVRN